MIEKTSSWEKSKLCLLPLILISVTASYAVEAPSGDTPPPMSLEQRRERAEKLRPRLEELTGQFEARTFDAGDGGGIPYRLFKPRERNPDEKYPLVVYLQWGGNVLRDYTSVEIWLWRHRDEPKQMADIPPRPHLAKNPAVRIT